MSPSPDEATSALPLGGAADDAYVEVAIDVPVDTAFTYAVPEGLRGRVVPGVRVLVPFRQRSRSGVVLATRPDRPEGLKRARKVADVLDATPVVPPAQLALLRTIARYYQHPIGEVVALALPGEAKVASSRWVEATGVAPPTGTDDISRRLAEAAATAARPLRPDDLLTMVRGARHLDLDAAETAGLLRSTYQSDGARVRERTETVVKLVTRGAGHLGAVQQRVIEWLVREREATASDLRHHTGSTAATLRSLAKRGLVELREVEVVRDPFARAPLERRGADPALTPQQTEALRAIRARTTQDGSAVTLLHGVTGSGKTEVYVRLIRDVVAAGRTALVLLPEIALTPQLVAVFRSTVDARIAVLHSGLSPGERFDQWRLIRDGRVDVVIGARSALFAPLVRLGLIIVDEEHDTSFKQHEGVPYNARDMAIVLGKQTGAAVVLGSATPSLESVQNSRRERYACVRMPDRVLDRPLPHVDVIDMRDHPPGEGDPVSALLSAPLQLAVREAVNAGEQAILFMNRRGFAPAVQCRSCGEILECSSCDVAVTYHRARDGVRCHYCGFEADRPRECPTCRAEELEEVGFGTEQIEHVVDRAFPGLRVGRLDRDTSRGQGLMRVLQRFRNQELDVLVGTQMVTKGHDFPNVTLVGIVDADQSLRFPDFRSGERTFQLLSQVSGRAGRGERPGRVLLQTWRPEHPVLDAVRAHDFDAYAEAELRFRQRLSYPPFGFIALLRLDAPDANALFGLGEAVAGYLRKDGPSELRVQGPVDAPIARVRQRFRMHVVLRSPSRRAVQRGVALARRFLDANARRIARDDARAAIDIDPQSML